MGVAIGVVFCVISCIVPPWQLCSRKQNPQRRRCGGWRVLGQEGKIVESGHRRINESLDVDAASRDVVKKLRLKRGDDGADPR